MDTSANQNASLNGQRPNGRPNGGVIGRRTRPEANGNGHLPTAKGNNGCQPTANGNNGRHLTASCNNDHQPTANGPACNGQPMAPNGSRNGQQRHQNGGRRRTHPGNGHHTNNGHKNLGHNNHHHGRRRRGNGSETNARTRQQRHQQQQQDNGSQALNGQPNGLPMGATEVLGCQPLQNGLSPAMPQPNDPQSPPNGPVSLPVGFVPSPPPQYCPPIGPSPPSMAQFVPSPPPMAQFVPSPPSMAQFVPSPPSMAQFVPSPPPMAQFVPSPPPMAQFVPSPPPMAQFVPSPPPMAQFVPSPPPMAQTAFGPIPPPNGQHMAQPVFIPSPPPNAYHMAQAALGPSPPSMVQPALGPSPPPPNAPPMVFGQQHHIPMMQQHCPNTASQQVVFGPSSSAQANPYQAVPVSTAPSGMMMPYSMAPYGAQQTGTVAAPIGQQFGFRQYNGQFNGQPAPTYVPTTVPTSVAMAGMQHQGAYQMFPDSQTHRRGFAPLAVHRQMVLHGARPQPDAPYFDLALFGETLYSSWHEQVERIRHVSRTTPSTPVPATDHEAFLRYQLQMLQSIGATIGPPNHLASFNPGVLPPILLVRFDSGMTVGLHQPSYAYPSGLVQPPRRRKDNSEISVEELVQELNLEE